MVTSSINATMHTMLQCSVLKCLRTVHYQILEGVGGGWGREGMADARLVLLAKKLFK